MGDFKIIVFHANVKKYNFPIGYLFEYKVDWYINRFIQIALKQA